MRLFLPAAILCLASPLSAAETKGVDLTLLSEQPSIVAGKTFTVAVKIHHQPHYHTYWQSPGVAGVPTTLTWTLPEGFTAGPIQWPAPEKTMMAKYPVHGYERDVMLLVDVTAPAQLYAFSNPVQLKVKAAWMACADGCFPGSTELSLSLPVAAAAGAPEPATAAAFTQARAELPQPLQGWKTEVLSAPEAAEVQLRLTPEDPGGIRPPEELYFFSSDGQVSSDQPQQVKVNQDGSIDLTAVRSEYGPKGSKTLPGVLMTATGFASPLITSIDYRAGGPKYASINPAYAVAAAAGSSEASEPAPGADARSITAPAKQCDCEKP